jgi:hypothetical protein
MVTAVTADQGSGAGEVRAVDRESAHTERVVTQRNRPVAADPELPEAAAPVLPVAARRGWLVGQWRFLVPATVAAATIAWVLGVVSGRAHGGVQAGLIVAGAVLTAVAVGLPLVQRRQAVQARADAVVAAQSARVALRVALQDALDPFVHLVGRLAQARAADKPRLRGEAIQLAVATLAALSGTERVRVCYFALDPGPPASLRPERFVGRAGAPTVAFTEGSPAGDAALRALRRGVWTYVEDTAVTRPRFWWDATPEVTAELDRAAQVGNPFVEFAHLCPNRAGSC